MSHTISSGKVLVTGANGFIAGWIVRYLLEAGYSVRAAVRSAEKGQHLEKQYKEKYGDEFEIVVVEDITKDGAFDEAVRGVDAIEHTASPVTVGAKDPSELIDPAVKGTVGILQSALKHGGSVKRIIYTSSCATIYPGKPLEKPTVYNEDDWNVEAVKKVEELGKQCPPMDQYRASKVLAEKAGWAFAETNKDQVGWDFVTLHPPMVVGPSIHDVSSMANLATSMKMWYQVAIGRDQGLIAQLRGASVSSGWVDVRDVATAHVRALQKEEAGGQRIIVSAGGYDIQDWMDLVDGKTPTTDPSTYMMTFDASKMAKILDVPCRSKEETVKDTLEDFASRGWPTKPSA